MFIFFTLDGAYLNNLMIDQKTFIYIRLYIEAIYTSKNILQFEIIQTYFFLDLNIHSIYVF